MARPQLHFQIDLELTLKTLDESHSADLFRAVDNNRSYLREWLPWLDSNNSIADSTAFIASVALQFDEGRGFQCGLFFNDELVGMCGYHPIDLSNNSVTIGYWLVEKMTGHGIVTRSTQFFVDYAFQTLELNKVLIPVAEENFRSRAVVERLGFVNEGVERQAEYLYGRYVNHVRYSMLKSEWQARVQS